MPDEEPLELTTVAFARETAAKGPGYRIKARGEIDAATAPTFVAALDAVLEQGATLVVLDASEIEFLDSSGLRVIVTFGNMLSAAGGRLLIEGMSGAVQRVLEVSGLIEKYRS